MKNGIIQLIDLEFEYKLWKNRLNLFLKEVDMLVKRNKQLAPQWKEHHLNTIEVIALDEHRDELEKSKKRIEVIEQELQYYNKDFPITEQHDYYIEHLKLRNHMDRLLYVHIDRINDLVSELGI